MLSTPAAIKRRTTRIASAGPSAVASGIWLPNAELVRRPGPDAKIRGPTIDPELMRSRIARSRNCTAPRFRIAVTPDASIARAARWPLNIPITAVYGGCGACCGGRLLGADAPPARWVCTSINPGTAVNCDRSMRSASLGTVASDVPTLLIRWSSTTTTAFVRTRPEPSTSLPNRRTFVAPNPYDASENSRTAKIMVLTTRMRTSLFSNGTATAKSSPVELQAETHDARCQKHRRQQVGTSRRPRQVDWRVRVGDVEHIDERRQLLVSEAKQLLNACVDQRDVRLTLRIQGLGQNLLRTGIQLRNDDSCERLSGLQPECRRHPHAPQHVDGTECFRRPCGEVVAPTVGVDRVVRIRRHRRRAQSVAEICGVLGVIQMVRERSL